MAPWISASGLSPIMILSCKFAPALLMANSKISFAGFIEFDFSEVITWVKYFARFALLILLHCVFSKPERQKNG